MDHNKQRTSTPNHAAKAPRQAAKRKGARRVAVAKQPSTPPILAGTAVAPAGRGPQTGTDDLRDRRLVRDLQENANRSDLTRHRREISATKEDHEDDDELEDESLRQPDPDTEPATVGNVFDTSHVIEKGPRRQP
jgi:hypothetical protein